MHRVVEVGATSEKPVMGELGTLIIYIKCFMIKHRFESVDASQPLLKVPLPLPRETLILISAANSLLLYIDYMFKRNLSHSG